MNAADPYHNQELSDAEESALASAESLRLSLHQLAPDQWPTNPELARAAQARIIVEAQKIADAAAQANTPRLTFLDEICNAEAGLKLANNLSDFETDHVPPWTRDQLLAEAQVHATLALTRAVAELRTRAMTTMRIETQSRGIKWLVLEDDEVICPTCKGAGRWDSCFDCGNRGYFDDQATLDERADQEGTGL